MFSRFLLQFFLLVISSVVFLQPHTASAAGIDNAWQMPPLTLVDTEAHERSLSDWKGKVILLNFWATWCPPCRYEIPRFIEYQQKYGKQGFQVVSVGLDDVKKLRNYKRSVGINFPVLVADPEKDLKLLPMWGDRQGILPFSVVIGPDGHLHFMRQGEFDDTAFEDFILPLLAKK